MPTIYPILVEECLTGKVLRRRIATNPLLKIEVVSPRILWGRIIWSEQSCSGKVMAIEKNQNTIVTRSIGFGIEIVKECL
jgi:hypothetical protein